LQNGEKDFYRINRIIDSDSITRYGETAAKPMKFYGLHGSRHTIAIISHIFDVFRDRVAGAAARLTLNVLPSMNNIEVGDIVNVNLQALRDHTGLNTFNRSMEVQAITIDQLTQSVKLTLYGSTQGAGIIEYGEETTLPDEWYCDESATEMTDLSTVLTITGGVVVRKSSSMDSLMYCGFIYAVASLTGLFLIKACRQIFYLFAKFYINRGLSQVL